MILRSNKNRSSHSSASSYTSSNKKKKAQISIFLDSHSNWGFCIATDGKPRLHACIFTSELPVGKPETCLESFQEFWKESPSDLKQFKQSHVEKLVFMSSLAQRWTLPSDITLQKLTQRRKKTQKIKSLFVYFPALPAGDYLCLKKKKKKRGRRKSNDITEYIKTSISERKTDQYK